MTRRENSVAVLMRITAFRRMWLALSTSSLGDWLGLLATTALAAYLTRDSSNLVQGAAVSGVLVTRLLPDLILGPIAGAVVDRLDRRKVAIFGDTAAGLLYLSIPFAGNLTWLLIAQFLAEGVGLFSNPAKQAMWVNIVPRERLAVANQLNYVSVYGMVPVAAVVFALLATIAQFFGAPPVPDAGATGALISVTSAAAINIALVIDAATYFLAAGVLFLTRHLIPAYLDERPPPKSVFSLIREGIGFVKNSPTMRAIYVGILGAFAAGGLVAGVAQAYVATMGGGNAGYGILFGTVFSGIALGMLIGPKVLPAVPRRMVFTLGIGVAGVALVVMSLVADFVGAAITSVVMGLFAGIAWITGFTMIGHEVADRLRGRVFAFVMSSVRIVLLGSIAVGPILANSLGVHAVQIGAYRFVFTGPGLVLAVSGLLTIGVAIFAGRQVGGLRGEFLRHLWRRIMRGRRRELLGVDEELPGVFITVVGSDADATGRYVDAVVTHVASTGWSVFVEPTPLPPWQPSDSESTALRVMAELADLAGTRVLPALEAGQVVVCRDYVDAAVVRFGAQAGLGEERIIRMADWSTGALHPNLTVLVDPASSQPTDDSEPAGDTGPADGADSDPAAPADDTARTYQDLAAAAPSRYVVVPPLGPDRALWPKLADRLESLFKARRVAHDGAAAGDRDGGPVVGLEAAVDATAGEPAAAGAVAGPARAGDDGATAEDGVIPADDTSDETATGDDIRPGDTDDAGEPEPRMVDRTR